MTPALAARLEALRLTELDGGSLDVAREIEALLSCQCDFNPRAAHERGCPVLTFYCP